MADNLKPCPFCGDVGRAVITTDEFHYVKCYGCGADGPYSSTEISAIAAWNRRASPWRDSEKEPPPKDGDYFWARYSAREAREVQWRGRWENEEGLEVPMPPYWMPIPPLEGS